MKTNAAIERTFIIWRNLLFGLGVLVTANAPADRAPRPDLIHHDVSVKIDPLTSTVEVSDSITLPMVSSGEPLIWTLGKNFTLEHSHPTLIPIELSDQVPDSPERENRRRHAAYRPSEPSRRIVVRYQGVVRAPRRNGRTLHTLGSVSERGVYLDGAAGWILHPPGRDFTFTLKPKLIEGWQAVSQGRRMADGSWRAKTPQQELYLIAGPLERWHLDDGSRPAVSAFLRRPDPALAERYNRRARDYINAYSTLVGPYPYPKFALVENFWPSGLGMPSFTLLGSKVIRLPFILDSSFPHEIAHNWWGNGVYPDHESGNWSEGLTAYMADHLVAENNGRGADFRRRALQKYRNFVTAEDDFSLRDFRGGHSAKDQAVGYNKALMLFHMLRLRLGDEGFIEGLRLLYKRWLFKTATYDDIRIVFEHVNKTDLRTFFAQWTERVGAPVLALTRVSVRTLEHNRHRVTVVLTQRADPPYELVIPVVVGDSGGGWIEHHARVTQGVTETSIDVSSPPRRVRIDPRFDVFRRLDASELPPALGELFGAHNAVVVVPAGAPRALRDAYDTLAHSWRRRFGWKVVPDTDYPGDTGANDRAAVWFLGRTNVHRSRVVRSIGKGFSAPPGGQTSQFTVDGKRYAQSTHSLAVASRDGDSAQGLLILDRPESAARLAKKLPRYSRFSYAVFAGPQVAIVARGTWAVANSVLDYRFDSNHSSGFRGAENPLRAPLPARKSLLQRFR